MNRKISKPKILMTLPKTMPTNVTMPTTLRIVIALFIVTAAGPRLELRGQEKFPKAWGLDATLRDICFTDHDMGWAVGDRGTILKTEDGGRSWQSISTPRDIIWSNVYFANDKIGWIAGGYYRGSLDRTVGIVIRTIDGGQSWENLTQTGLSFVKDMEFIDEQTGWLHCDSNHICPSGLMVTHDGGNSWKSAPGFANQSLLIGHWGPRRELFGADPEHRWIETDRTGKRVGQQVDLIHPRQLIRTQSGLTLAIDSGQLLQKPKGQPFSRCVTGLPNHVVHWRKLFHNKQEIWAVGSPGSVVLHSRDEGQTWKTHLTGHHEALESVFFLNADRGWAVGSCGKIIATRDGGKTWNVQRNQNSRLGVLMLTSDQDQPQLGSLALLSGSFNHLCGIAAVSPPTRKVQRNDWRWFQAMNRIGVSAMDQQLTSPNEWDREVVKLIRSWRPAVIIVDEREHRLKEGIQQLVEWSSNVEKYPRLNELGIHPWKVEKVICVSDSTELRLSLSTDQYSAHLGKTVSLQSRFAGQLLPQNDGLWKRDLYWQPLYSKNKNVASDQGLTTGTSAYSHPDCRRLAEELQINNLQQFRSIANWNQSLERLGRFLILTPFDEKSWLDQITAATSGMDSISLVFFLQDLAHLYHQLKKPVMADHTERLILQKGLDTDVGEQTLWKMIQRYASDESNRELNKLVRQRMEATQPSPGNGNRAASLDLTIDPVRSTGVSGDSTSTGNLANGTASNAGYETDVTPASLRNANQLIQIFQQQFADQNVNPKFELPIAWIKAKSGNRAALDRLLDSSQVKSLGELADRRIRRELALGKSLDHPGDLPDGQLVAPYADQHQVTLDGRLLESVWQSESARDDNGVRFAFDDQFLYLAGAIKTYERNTRDQKQRRTRDESLEGNDRIEIFLDLDRDYCSGIQLSIAANGSCNDLLWRDSLTPDFSYDPTWYVASNVQDSIWRFECAIPIDQLPTGRLSHSSNWVVSSRFLSRNRKTPRSVDSFFNREKMLRFSWPNPTPPTRPSDAP